MLSALHGRRDIILPKVLNHRKRSSTLSSCSSGSVSDGRRSSLSPGTPSEPLAAVGGLHSRRTSSCSTGGGAVGEVSGLQAITRLDQTLRDNKLARFNSAIEARRLACAVRGHTDPPFFYFTGLRIVDIVELAGLASADMYSMVEWAGTLPFFAQLNVAHRSAALRRFSVHQLVIETGYCTALSPYNHVWMMPNGTCMPRDVRFLPEESQVSAQRSR